MSNRKLLALAPVALAALASLPASAAESASVNMLYAGPSTIEVVSNGQAYTGTAIPLVRIAGRARLQLDPGASGRVKSWTVWPHVALSQGLPAEMEFKQDKTSRSYGVGDRPKTVDQEVQVALSPEATRQVALTACAGRLMSLRNSGKSDAEIFGQDQIVKISVAARLSHEFSGVTGVQSPTEVGGPPPSIDIVCKAPKPGAGGAAVGGGIPANTPALLQAVAIGMQFPPTPTQCPANVTAHMTFRADASQPPGYVQYRVRSLSGKVSPPAVLKFEASDRNGAHYVKSVSQNFMVGTPPAPTPVSPAAGRQAAGGLAAPTLPDPNVSGPATSGGLGGSAVGGGYSTGAAPTPSNVHKDSLWVEIITAAPGSATKSDYGAYTVTCDTITSGVGSGAPGGMQRTPLTPPPPPTKPAGEAQPTAQPTPPGGKADPAGAPQPPARPSVPLGLSGGAQTAAPVAPPATPAPTGNQQQTQPSVPQSSARPAAPAALAPAAQQPQPAKALAAPAVPAASQPRR